MSLQRQLEHIVDEIDAARNRVSKLQEIVATAELEGVSITYNELGNNRDLLRHAGGSLNQSVRIIATIMSESMSMQQGFEKVSKGDWNLKDMADAIKSGEVDCPDGVSTYHTKGSE